MARILFKDFAEVKGYVGTTHRMELATLKGYAFQAVERYLVPVLGRACFDALLDAYIGNTLSVADTALLERVQRPLAFYTMLEAGPALLVQTGEAGIMQVGAEYATPASQWQVRGLLESWLQSGDLFTDLLLEFLEKHQEDYPVWRNSEAYTREAACVIRSTEDLSDFVNIQGSRRTMLALRPYLRRAQELALPEVLGAGLFAALTDHLVGTAILPELQVLALRCRPFVAHSAMVEAIPEMTLQLSGSGIKVLQYADGITSKLQASDQALAVLQEKHERLAKTYRVALVNFLEANAATYPQYVPAAIGSTPFLTRLPEFDPTAKSFLF